MNAVIETQGLGKRYGRRWALSDCTLTVPAGRVVGLVGPNGAGKTTLLQLTVGLVAPTAGEVHVLGERPASGPEMLGRVGFVAQDTPTYAGLSVADHLRLGAWLNPRFDSASAARRVDELGLDRARRTGRLSGGERAQLALAIAVAKRPDLLVLDEPVASLDPLARRAFLDHLADVVEEREVSVVMSSHLVSDLERVCDYLIVVVASRLLLCGDVSALLSTHRRVRRAAGGPSALPPWWEAIEPAGAGNGRAVLVRSDRPFEGAESDVEPVDLEDLVLAYMGRAVADGPGGGAAWRNGGAA